MKIFFLTLSFLFITVFTFSQCIFIDFQVLSEPYCPASFNGGQLKANVSGGTGFYTFEWLNENGGNLPGGPQTSAITNSFLPANQAIWVYVTDTFQNCTDSASYTFTSYSCDPDTAKLEILSPFDINPVGYNTFTECDIKLTNLGCQVSFKPEFIVSHVTDTLEQGDFTIEYFNAQSSWEVIPYTINSDGNAIGYWGGQSGQNLNCEEERVRPVRVKFNQFNPEAPLGEYTALLRLWSVDQSGNLLSIISEQDQVSVTLIDTICNTLSISSTVTDASCPEQTDGQIQISSTGGQSPFEYSVNDGTFSSNSLYTSLSSGLYTLVVKDSLECQESDTVFVNPEPSLPDTLWFTGITPFDAVINWTADSTVDGYRFRYREMGQTWQIVALGIFNDNIAEILSSKSISGLSPLTTYEVQVKTNSITDCIEGWSTSFFFTTPMEPYTYDVLFTCNGVSSGQILFDVQTLNSYTFEWTGPNGFSSTDTSIYQLAQGDYNLEVFNNNTQVIFDTIFSVENPSLSIQLFYDTIYCVSPFLNSLTNQSDNGGFSVQAYGSISNTYYYSLDELDSTIFLNQGIFSELEPGDYSLNVKDSLGCISEFEVNIPSISMNYDYTANDISCAGFNDGYVQINSLQGDVASPWVEVDNSPPNNPNLFTNLGVGEHVITAYYNYPDGSSFCYKTDTFEFFEKEELYVSLDLNSVSCYDSCDAIISIDSTYGGTEPYTFICLNNLDTNYLFDNLCAGEYSIKMIDDNGCFLIEDIVVNEGNVIYPLISFEDGELTVVQPTLQNPSMGIPPYSYQWYEDNSLLPGAVSEVYNPNYTGLYSVVVTDSVDCKGMSSIYKIEILDLSSWASGVDVNIFPNPFVDELNVTIYSTSGYEWLLRDISGKVVESGMDEHSWKINTSTLPNGMYILNVFSADEQLIYKIMKQ